MEIKLSNCELSVTVDVEDLNTILSHSECWSAEFRTKSGGKRHVLKAIKAWSTILQKPVRLSRVILDYYGPLVVDHKDRNILNNQRDNLRVVSQSQNMLNKSVYTEGYSKYKGVTKSLGRRKPWVAAIEYRGIKYCGGYFASEKAAAMKANDLMAEHHGEFAYKNIID